MRKNYLIAVAVLGILAIVYILTNSFQTPTNFPPSNSTIVAFGDSLIQGVGSTNNSDFISLLSQKIGKPIVNMGVSGNTTAMGLERIDAVIAQKPGTVIVLFGGNDFLRKVPKAETFANLGRIINRLQSSGAMVVLLGIRGGVLSDPYKAEFEKLSEGAKVVYVSDVLSGLVGDSRYMHDAVHPNDEGYKIIASRVYAAIKDMI